MHFLSPPHFNLIKIRGERTFLHKGLRTFMKWMNRTIEEFSMREKQVWLWILKFFFSVNLSKMYSVATSN